jgi:hypothetical protein
MFAAGPGERTAGIDGRGEGARRCSHHGAGSVRIRLVHRCWLSPSSHSSRPWWSCARALSLGARGRGRRWLSRSLSSLSSGTSACGRCGRSALETLVGLPGEPLIVVVDSGSTDGTGEYVRCRFPLVKVIDASRNMGAAGLNRAVAAAGRPYVALADDDSW